MFGILNCHKPVGLSSRTIVDLVQRRLRPIKVGHAGTLDPLASGLLLLGVGAGARLVPYLQAQPKHYTAEFRFGVRSPSGDLEEELIPHPRAPQPSSLQIDEAIQRQLGTIEQVPPTHSAIKIEGRRAYDLVRAGKPVEMKPRRVVIHSIEVRRYAYPHLELNIVCGSGTYVRSIGTDIAAFCQTYAVMSSLVRTQVGSFVLADALRPEQLREENLAARLSPLVAAVPHLPKLRFDDALMQRVAHGQVVPIAGAPAGETGELAALDAQGTLRAIMIPRHGGWRARRVFPPAWNASPADSSSTGC